MGISGDRTLRSDLGSILMLILNGSVKQGGGERNPVLKLFGILD